MTNPSLYFDGVVAKGRPATLTFTDRELRIFCSGGLEILWPLKNLRYVAPPTDGQPARLRNSYDQPDRLTLSDDFDLAGLQSMCPNLAKGNTGWSRNWKKITLWIGAAAASVIFLMTVAIPVIAHQVAVNLPEDFKRHIGARAKEQIIYALSLGRETEKSGSKFCTGAGLDNISRLVATLSENSENKMAINVEVLNLDINNAFALPGGNVILFKGLLKDLKHPNELAGILAHEISHIHYRHPTEIFIKEIGTYALIGLIFGDVTGGSAMAGMGKTLIGSAYGRDAEREADNFGVDLMNKAGFDAAPLADFLDRLHAEQGKIEELFSFVSTHPASIERAAAVRKMSLKSGQSISNENWQTIKDMCG
jgi:predicted Zn-dependent protease